MWIVMSTVFISAFWWCIRPLPGLFIFWTSPKHVVVYAVRISEHLDVIWLGFRGETGGKYSSRDFCIFLTIDRSMVRNRSIDGQWRSINRWYSNDRSMVNDDRSIHGTTIDRSIVTAAKWFYKIDHNFLLGSPNDARFLALDSYFNELLF